MDPPLAAIRRAFASECLVTMSPAVTPCSIMLNRDAAEKFARSTPGRTRSQGFGLQIQISAGAGRSHAGRIFGAGVDGPPHEHALCSTRDSRSRFTAARRGRDRGLLRAGAVPPRPRRPCSGSASAACEREVLDVRRLFAQRVLGVDNQRLSEALAGSRADVITSRFAFYFVATAVSSWSIIWRNISSG
ncbi:MAG: hypothetical protein V7647_1363 [Acidobacteriota bacterium]